MDAATGNIRVHKSLHKLFVFDYTIFMFIIKRAVADGIFGTEYAPLITDHTLTEKKNSNTRIPAFLRIFLFFYADKPKAAVCPAASKKSPGAEGAAPPPHRAAIVSARHTGEFARHTGEAASPIDEFASPISEFAGPVGECARHTGECAGPVGECARRTGEADSLTNEFAGPVGRKKSMKTKTTVIAGLLPDYVMEPAATGKHSNPAGWTRIKRKHGMYGKKE